VLTPMFFGWAHWAETVYSDGLEHLLRRFGPISAPWVKDPRNTVVAFGAVW
jgi:hypothetical protein